MTTAPVLPADLAQQIPAVWADLRWSAPTEIAPLHGDASARRYFRVAGSDASRMLMVLPQGPASISEEIGKPVTAATLPFLQIRDELDALGLPVPPLLHYDAARGWIVLGDLGDVQLATHVQHGDTPTRMRWYQRAIDLLCTMHAAADQLPAASIVRQRAFDADLLNWEFDHFWEYGLLARGMKPTDAVRAEFVERTRVITAQIAAMPYEFTHRDFQSRNLMAVDEQLVLIDFQDALQGPYIYDVVSLLRDSYVQLTPVELSQLIAYHAERSGRLLAQVQQDFALMTVQRKLKDAGRFVYINQVKGNPKFLPFIIPSLGYVRHALTSQPGLQPLLQLLQPYVPEWNG